MGMKTVTLPNNTGKVLAESITSITMLPRALRRERTDDETNWTITLTLVSGTPITTFSMYGDDRGKRLPVEEQLRLATLDMERMIREWEHYLNAPKVHMYDTVGRLERKREAAERTEAQKAEKEQAEYSKALEVFKSSIMQLMDPEKRTRLQDLKKVSMPEICKGQYALQRVLSSLCADGKIRKLKDLDTGDTIYFSV